MAQQDNTAASTPAEVEPNRVFWARSYLTRMASAERLHVMACGFGIGTDNRWALNAGAYALEGVADKCLHYAHDAGGLLFCWIGSALEGGAA